MITGAKQRGKGQYACKGMLQVLDRYMQRVAKGYREYMHACEVGGAALLGLSKVGLPA
jgi:hypothetical protein